MLCGCAHGSGGRGKQLTDCRSSFHLSGTAHTRTQGAQRGGLRPFYARDGAGRDVTERVEKAVEYSRAGPARGSGCTRFCARATAVEGGGDECAPLPLFTVAPGRPAACSSAHPIRGCTSSRLRVTAFTSLGYGRLSLMYRWVVCHITRVRRRSGKRRGSGQQRRHTRTHT